VRVTIAGAYPFIKVLAPVGSNDGEVIRPRGIARNANGDLFVMDEGNSRIDKFDSSGRFLFSFGSSGIGDGQFDSPKDLAIDRWSSIYVTDNGQRSIQKYDSSGTFIKKWYTKGSPWGISVSPENIIYVALESDSSSIQAFDTGGASINELRTSQGNYDIFAGKGDTLLVSTISYTMDFFINTYVHGALINNWRISKEVSTCTFAFDDQGNLYVCGLLGSSCVEIFNAKNELIGRFGALGTREGAITSPNWIYLVGNKIYISANNGVLLFQKP
jgi:sugar lactone lactonase YvrE